MADTFSSDAGTDVLSALVEARREAARAERRVLRLVADFAAAHPAPGIAEPGPAGHEEMVELAGVGAPGIAEFAIAELGAALGLSTVAAKRLIGQALELAHRLPQSWERLCTETDGGVGNPDGVAAWRARMVAERTVLLSPAAAAYVDAQVAPMLDKLGPTRLMRIVDAAVVLCDPAASDRLAEEATRREVRLDLGSGAGRGTAYLDARLDVADALDLDAALRAAAADLKRPGGPGGEHGDPSPLDVRRARALGTLARHYLATHDATRESGARQGGVQLVVHYRPDSDAAGVGVAELANTPALVTLDQIAAWCARGGATVKVLPVVDLAEDLTAGGYVPSPRLRTQVQLRDKTCVFPHCTSRARRADLDHTVPYDPGGPPGQTRSTNIAALCRFHHRLKTHSAWAYHHLAPGWYHWRAPDGRHYLRGPTGAVALDQRSMLQCPDGLSDPGRPVREAG